MSAGANKAFRNDPRAFLYRNVILIKEGIMPSQPGCYLMNLRPAGSDTVTDDRGQNLGVYSPVLAQPDPTASQQEVLQDEGNALVRSVTVAGASKSTFSNQFRAWYLPWGKDQEFTVDLHTTADYFFTPGLSGCTFAAVGGNVPTVGHFNYVQAGVEPEVVDDAQTAARVQASFGRQTAARLQKSDYADPTGAAVHLAYIVGWRTKYCWTFFAQHLIYKGTGSGKIFERKVPPQRLMFVHKI